VTGSGCSYALASDAAWLVLTAAGSGTTSEPVGFNAMPNPHAIERAGSITASFTGGSTKVTITQAGIANCTYTLSPASQDVPNAGGSFGFVANRNTQNGCSFAVSTTTPWITFTGPTTGLSGATVTYAVQANGTGAGRTGAINVIWSGGSVDFIVTQQP
jgi:hypothetical protein